MKTTLLTVLLFLSALAVQAQQLISSYSESFNQGWQPAWINISYAYYPDGTLAQKTIYNYDITTQTTYHYTNDRLTLITGSRLDTTTQQWTDGSREIYTYNTAGKITEIVNEDLDFYSPVWYIRSREERSYDPLTGDHISSIIQTSIGAGWPLLPDDKIDYTYNGGVLESSVSYNWVNSAWEPIWRYNFTYTAFGEPDVTTKQWWGNGAWNDLHVISSIYDANEILTQKTTEVWDNAVLKNLFRINYAYNADGTLHQDVTQYWNEVQEAYTDTSRNTYNYGIATLGTTETLLSDFSVFPNPAHDMVHISFEQVAEATVSLTDLHGKVLRSEAVSGQLYTLPLEGLSAGVYLLTVKRGEELEVRKILKD